MRISFKAILTVAAAAAIVIMAAPAANAQCSPAQVFGSTGLGKLGMVQVEIAGGLTGTEIGSFWVAGNSANGSNAGGNCTADKWLVSRPSGDRGVSAAIGDGTLPCFASSCPAPSDEMIFVVEDYGPSGSPGVGDTAFFIGFRMDATPAAARYWDLARAAGNVAQTLPWIQYPDAVVTSSTRSPGAVDTQQDYADVGLNFHGANAGGAIPDTASILSFDVCTFHGPLDPGRNRSAWTGGCTPIAYNGGASTNNAVSIPCPDDGMDTYVAVGATFSGGVGPAVASNLVGRAVAMECDPNVANPDDDLQQRPRIRPKKRGRSGR